MATDTNPDIQRIDQILAEVERVWKRNPGKKFMRLVSRVTRDSTAFDPFDTSDEHVLAQLRSIAPGQR